MFTGVYMRSASHFELKLDDIKNVGELLKKYRKEKKITQEDLAKYAGLSRIGVVKLENNEGDIKVSTLIKISNILGFDLVLKKRATK